MGYSLFYNYKGIGDVLLIVFENDLDATKYQKIDDVVAIYHYDKIIGYNIFNISKIIKIHHRGLLLSPIQPLIDIINSILINHSLSPLNTKQDPSFIIGKIIEINQKYCCVDLKSKIIKVATINGIKTNDIVVVFKNHSFTLDGIYHNFGKMDGMIASYRQLGMKECDDVYKINDDELVGKDLFLGEEKWNN